MSKIRSVSTGSGCDICKAQNPRKTGNKLKRAIRACKECTLYLCYSHAKDHSKVNCK